MTLALASFLLSGCPGPDVEPVNTDAGGNDATTDGPVEPVAVTVVTWNVLNFYNDVRDSLEITASNETIVPTAEYQAKLTGIAGVLNSQGAQIAVLQEVENLNVIDDLAERAGRYPHRHITQGNDPRGIDIAILSDFPIDNVVTHKDTVFQVSTSPTTNFKFSRDLLEAHLTINGRKMVFLGVHYKSGLTPADQTKRLAEAEHTRAILTQVKFNDPSTAVVVLGDFNATPDSTALQALYGAPPLVLTSATLEVPPGERYTVTYGGNKQLYDDQLADPTAFSMLNTTFAESILILHSSEVNKYADHDPVRAVYDIR